LVREAVEAIGGQLKAEEPSRPALRARLAALAAGAGAATGLVDAVTRLSEAVERLFQ
jgi:hypothetical protein